MIVNTSRGGMVEKSPSFNHNTFATPAPSGLECGKCDERVYIEIEHDKKWGMLGPHCKKCGNIAYFGRESRFPFRIIKEEEVTVMAGNVEMGKRIEALRIEKNMTNVDLAGRIGKSAPYVSNIQKGRDGGSPDVLEAIARALDTTVEYLKTGKQPESPIGAKPEGEERGQQRQQGEAHEPPPPSKEPVEPPKEKYDAKGPYIVWMRNGQQGYQPKSYGSIEEITTDIMNGSLLALGMLVTRRLTVTLQVTEG
jgi:transcriptional regulator with XRE-family HTH domain